MHAVRLADAPDHAPPSLVLDDMPEPQPGPGDLLIRVCAAGVTAGELSWYPTTHRPDGQPRRHAVPGHEFSGIVAGVGAAAEGFATGSAVFGMNGWFADGAMAEFCVAPSSFVAAKPRTVSHAEAASLPIPALTAWQGLYEHARLRPGETVLVHGGSGGVGVFAVQLARLHGARVVATASSRHAGFVSSLGAERVVDYTRVRFEEAVPPVDVVFDTVGGETLQRSWAVLKPDGRLVTVASDAEGSSDPRVRTAFFIVEPKPEQLTSVAELIDAGRLRPVVDLVAPLAQAPDVFAGKVARRGPGKAVIAIAGEG